jgi:GDP-D-mannose 3', 5'-epimerase
MHGFSAAVEPSSRRVLVTGAGGFLGHHLVTALNAMGFWVRGVDVRFPPFASSLADDYRLLDLTDASVCRDMTRDVDDVFALAAGARRSPTDAAAALYNDVLVVANTAMAAAENGVARIVLAGTYTEADDPDAVDEPVRLVRELARRWSSATDVRVVRAPHVFGELDAWERRSERSIAALCRRFASAALAGATAVEAPVDRRCRRRYLYVDELVETLVEAMWAPSAAPVLDVPGEEVSAGDVLDELGRLAGIGRPCTMPRPSPLGELSRTYAWADSEVRRELAAWEPDDGGSLEAVGDDSDTFAYTVYIDGEPGEEGYVVLSEPLRDYVIAPDCRGDDGDESLMLITHVHAHPEDGRPGVAAGSLLAGSASL